MSRHRLVKKMNIADELDDDALSDGGEDDLTPKQQVQMSDGLARVRAILGPPEESGLEDSVIKDALWNEYFDVENAIQGLLDERERHQKATERKERRKSKELPALPTDFHENSQDSSDEEGFYQDDVSSHAPRSYDIAGGRELDMDGRSRVPLIVLAQQSQHPPPPELSDPGTVPMKNRLSTISEKSERTEASRHWPSKQQLYAYNDPQPSSPMSSNTSYGQLIERADKSQSQFAIEYDEIEPIPVDPNDIPPSPSPSAQLRLSQYEPAPSVATSESRSTPTPPRTPPAPLPPMETIPDIPDYKSKSTARPVPQPQQYTIGSPKKSKLSALASSRASSATKSSRTPQADSNRGRNGADSASVITYPVLRPSTASRKSLSVMSATTSSSISTVKPRPQPPVPTSPAPSSTSSHVRRAIQTALELEATDRGETPRTKSQTIPPLSTDTSKTASGPPPIQLQLQTSELIPLSPTDSHTKGRPSKLALLAQAKANANSQQGLWMPSAKSSKARYQSLPDSHTEYVTPIANGPTATTAITTSYQSLYSLKSFPSVMPALPPSTVNPPQLLNNSTSLAEPKQSKLAMKSKRGHEKPSHKHSPVEEDFQDFGFTPPVSPMFLPKTTHSRALPSAFASLLVDDRLICSDSEDKGMHKGKEKRREDSKFMESPSSINLPAEAAEKPTHRRRTRPESFSPGRFAFDIPSPDDIVLNARRGTSLAQRR